MTLKIVNNSDPGDADHIGGNDWDTIANGINLGEGYSYLIRKSGSTYYAKNSAGEIAFSNASFYSVLSSALSALSSAGGGLIQLGPGDFSLTTQLVITGTAGNNIWIRGSGVDTTRIVYDMTTITAGMRTVGTRSADYTLTGNTAIATRVITVASTTGLSAGDWILLGHQVETTSGSTGRYDAEIHKIETVDSSTQITLEDQVHENYNTSELSWFNKITWVSNFHMSDLTIYDNRGDTTNPGSDGDCYFYMCYNLRLNNIKWHNMVFASCTVESCFNCSLTDQYYELPRFTSATTAGLIYGLYITGATTNLSVKGGWGNRCRHTITTNTNSGAARAGRRRNITINGVTGYNNTTATFDLHQGDVAVVFNSCAALAGHHGTVTTDAQGFNLRSPATLIGCQVDGLTQQAMVIWNDDDSAESGLTPGGNRTTIIGCRIRRTHKGDTGDTEEAIRIETNRQAVSIIGCQFYGIADSCIDMDDEVKNVIIQGNMFDTCGSDLTSAQGMIRINADADNVIINGNIFGAGTPPANARPLVVTGTVDGLVFTDNNVRGLTNRTPTITANSTEVRIESNSGCNPIGNITNPINTTNNTIGTYGGTTATATTAIDYTVVGAPILLSITAGTVSDITIKGPAGNTVSSAETSIKSRYIPVGFKVNITHTGAPTIIASAV